MLQCLFHSPASGWRGNLPLVLRVIAGLIFVGAGILKFTAHAEEVRAFEGYGFTNPDQLVYAIGLVELAGGTCLLLGFLTRLAALGLAVNMAVATATAGPSVVNLALLATMIALVILGGGRLALDRRILARMQRRS